MSALLEAARGAWPFKNCEPLAMGIEDGIVWAVSKAPYCGVNGYVLVPAEGHPWSAGVPSIDKCPDEDGEYSYRDWESEARLSVHGGITYGAAGPWIGFDTAHAGDIWGPEFDTTGFSRDYPRASFDKDWTVDLVIEEAKNLARQLAAVVS